MENALTAKKKFLVFGISFLIFLNIVYANIMISEIMYDAIGSDDDHEWIEIYNNGTAVDLNGWKFFEEETNHNLYLKQGNSTIPENSYAIIAENWTMFLIDYNYNGTLFDSSFSLSNSGESLALKNSSLAVMENITYSSSYGGAGNGYSIGRISNNWSEMIPSPGFANSANDQNLCDWKIEILIDKYIFENKTDFSWSLKISKNFGNTANITIDRIIEDEFESSAQSYNQLIHSIDNQETLSYSPNLDPGAYLIKANISVTSCNDTLTTNNYDSKLIAIKHEANKDDPYIKIYKIYDLGTDNKAKFGQIIKVKLNVYKGNSTREAVNLWVENSEKISKITKFNVYDEYANYTLTLPIQLFANCNNEYEDGKHNIVVEGLDKSDSMEIDVEGITDSLCEEIEIENSKESDFEVLESPNEAVAGYDFFTKINIKNNEENNQKFQVWSYVYNGRKIYGKKEGNMQEISLSKNSEMIVELKNNVVGIEEGDYKLKINVRKSSKKTASSVTKNIKMYEEAFESIGYVTASNDNFESIKNNENLQEITSKVVYESKDIKERKTAIYSFSFLLMIMLVYVLLKKND